MGAGVVGTGLLLSAIGFGGKCLVKQIPKVTTHMNQAFKFLPSTKVSSKYFKGGFESSMTKKEACLILGISGPVSPLKIKEAYKRTMQLNHPDRGGSPYLAAKINEARALIENCKP